MRSDRAERLWTALASCVGAALCAAAFSAAPGSASALLVDGGVLQTWTLPGPGEVPGTDSPATDERAVVAPPSPAAEPGPETSTGSSSGTTGAPTPTPTDAGSPSPSTTPDAPSPSTTPDASDPSDAPDASVGVATGL